MVFVKTVVCSAVPYPSADLGERKGITGTWVQLEDSSHNVIYRLDLPSAITVNLLESGEAENEIFDVLVPNYPDAQYAAVYSPPAAEDAAQQPLSNESVLLLRTSMTDAVHADIKAVPSLPADICGDGRGQILKKYAAVYNRNH